MTIAVAYKWAANPQDASVAADGTVDWSRAKLAVSEYDLIAIQVGRALADAEKAELVGISVGTEAVASSMAKKAALSRGLDRAVVVSDQDTATWNQTEIARSLAGIVRAVDDVSLVLTGDASIDENAKMVSALIAGSLGCPCFQDVIAVQGSNGHWQITQNTDQGTRTIEFSGMAVLGIAVGAAKVKVPGMKDILAAGKKKLDLLTPDDVAGETIPVEVVARSKPESRARKNMILPDADALVGALRADGVL